jgi:hypothetical protein
VISRFQWSSGHTKGLFHDPLSYLLSTLYGHNGFVPQLVAQIRIGQHGPRGLNMGKKQGNPIGL